VRGETSSKILAVGLEDHHQAPAEQVDVHLADARPTQARHDLGPDLLVMCTICLDRCLISVEVDGEHGARYHPLPPRDYFTLAGPESKPVLQDCVYFSVKVWFLPALELV